MLDKIKYIIIDKYRGTRVIKDIRDIKIETSKDYNELLDIQKRKLIELLLHSRRYVSFYSDKLNKIKEEEIEESPYKILSRLPVVDKELISNNKDFISSKLYPNIQNHTGGSTGQPLTYFIDLFSISRDIAFSRYLWNHTFGYEFGDVILAIGGSSIGNGRQFKLKIYNWLQSKIFIEGGNISPDLVKKNARIICEGDYDLIYAYPSSLMMYVNASLDLGLKFNGNIKGIITTSENLLPNVRNQLQIFFRTNVYDAYGARDGGIVSNECKMKNGFHYNVQDCIVEEYKESDVGVPELLLTNLNSFSMPFIRYRVGDLGKLSEHKCECGSPLPLITNFSGRTRDIIKLANGGIIHGSLFNKVISHFPEILQFQVISKPESIRIVIKTINEFNPEKVSNLSSELIKLIGTQINIEIDTSAKFIYTEAGKLKTIISENK